MPKSYRAALTLLAAFALSACGASAPTASDSPTPEPTSTKYGLNLTGTLFFHNYSEYGAWDADLWALDLSTGDLNQLDKDWTGVISPINAQANEAGDALVFMGSASGLQENDWDVFVSHWNGTSWAEPINLTGPNDKRDEDPKFSPDGQTIAYKHAGILYTMNSDGSNKTSLSRGKSESSIPYFTPDGKGIIFEREGSIWLIDVATQAEKIIWEKGSTHGYYPVGVDSEKFLFSEVQTNQHDRTMWGFYDGSPAEPLFYESTKCDNSDPWPYQDGSQYIFYVTGCGWIFEGGGYNLAVADLQNKKSYSLGNLNANVTTQLAELGPSWSASAKIGK
jgi:hypothetical protein